MDLEGLRLEETLLKSSPRSCGKVGCTGGIWAMFGGKCGIDGFYGQLLSIFSICLVFLERPSSSRSRLESILHLLSTPGPGPVTFYNRNSHLNAQLSASEAPLGTSYYMGVNS
jgi:hypothetical protein